MSNAALGYMNFFTASGSIVSDQSHATGFGAANLAGPVGLPGWQSVAGVKTTSIDIDAGVAVSWADAAAGGAVGLFRTNFTNGANLRVRLGTTQGASDVYDSGILTGVVQVGYGQGIILIPAGTGAARWMRFTIGDSTNPDNFIRAGLAFAGPLWQPANNFAYGATNGFQNDSDVQVTRGGQEYVNEKPNYRSGAFAFQLLTASEVNGNVNDIDRTLSIKSNLLFLPDPASSNLQKEAIFGRITKSDQSAHSDFGIHTKNYAIRERL